MYVIGITGLKRHGKGEVGEAIKRLVPGAKACGFADKLKLCAARSLGFDRPEADLIALMDNFKIDAEFSIHYTEVGEEGTEFYTTHELTGREYLQFMGTEGGRETFGDTFWIDQVLPNPANISDLHGDDWQAILEGQLWDLHGDVPVLAITDIRFDNEAQRVKNCGGQIWEVVRPDLVDSSADTHSSEAGIDQALVDTVIINNGTLQNLEWRVECALELMDNAWYTAEKALRALSR